MELSEKTQFDALYWARNAEEYPGYSLEEMLIAKEFADEVQTLELDGKKAGKVDMDEDRLFRIMVQYLPDLIKATARNAVSDVVKAYLNNGMNVAAALSAAGGAAVRGSPHNHKTPGEEQ